jgi:dihydroneopterin aldolase
MDRLKGLNRISVTGIDVLGHHGVNEAEREVGQRLSIDLDIYLDLSEAIVGDDIHKTVNYEQVCKLVERVSGEEEFLLLESLASEIGDKIMEQYRPVGVVVRVSKVNPPIAIRVGSVAVEITKLREDTGG